MSNMKIAKIRISNILGIDELEITPGGTITEITGKNGSGKTSILEAIKAVVKGGHDATLLRKGKDKGEIVLVMDDLAGTQIHKKVTAEGSSTSLYQNDKKVPSPGGTIKQLVDMLAVNPVDFLTAAPKDRMKVLLESIPVEVDIERLQTMSNMKLGDGTRSLHGLQILAYVHKSIFDDRTGTNRAISEKESTINQLTLTLPDVPGDAPSNEAELRAKVDEATAARDAELDRVQIKWNSVQAASNEEQNRLRTEAQRQIDAIKEQLQKDLDAERQKLTNIESRANQQREKARTTFTTTTESLQQSLATIVAQREAFAKRAQSETIISKMNEELSDLKSDAERQTKALKDIDAYKSELLAKLPIPGLTVSDGEVIRDGVPFDRLNTAQQVDIAIEIAKLRAGPLAVCCVDRFEALDPATLAAFKERAEASNLQLFVTRVDSGDMKIATA